MIVESMSDNTSTTFKQPGGRLQQQHACRVPGRAAYAAAAMQHRRCKLQVRLIRPFAVNHLDHDVCSFVKACVILGGHVHDTLGDRQV